MGPLIKVHHSMVDGVAGADLMAAMLDVEPEPLRPPSDHSWTPEPDPSSVSLLLGAATHLAETIVSRSRVLPATVHTPLVRCRESQR